MGGWIEVSTAALAVGLMLSPESLVRVGNGAGNGGGVYLLAMVGSAAVHSLWFQCLRSGIDERRNFEEPESMLIQAFGPLPAVWFSLTARGILFLGLSTGILATAGFAFNEIFARWFPNFAFAFSLLAVVLGINLLGRKAVETTQILFATTAALGLVILSLWAVFEPGFGTQAPPDVPPRTIVRSFISGLIVLLGFDLALYGRKEPNFDPGKAVMGAIISMAAVFAAWAAASAGVVPPVDLAQSTIPHLIAARRIGGDTARKIMGIVVVSGTAAALNAFLFGASRALSRLARENPLSAPPGGMESVPRGVLVLLAGAVAAMIAAGMAGSPGLEILIRTGWIFWLFFYAAVGFSALRLQAGGGAGRSGWSRSRFSTALGLLGCFGGAVGLAATDPQRRQLIQCLAPSALIALLLALGYVHFRLPRPSPPRRGIASDHTGRSNLRSKGE